MWYRIHHFWCRSQHIWYKIRHLHLPPRCPCRYAAAPCRQTRKSHLRSEGCKTILLSSVFRWKTSRKSSFYVKIIVFMWKPSFLMWKPSFLMWKSSFFYVKIIVSHVKIIVSYVNMPVNVARPYVQEVALGGVLTERNWAFWIQIRSSLIESWQNTAHCNANSSIFNKEFIICNTKAIILNPKSSLFNVTPIILWYLAEDRIVAIDIRRVICARRHANSTTTCSPNSIIFNANSIFSMQIPSFSMQIPSFPMQIPSFPIQIPSFLIPPQPAEDTIPTAPQPMFVLFWL